MYVYTFPKGIMLVTLPGFDPGTSQVQHPNHYDTYTTDRLTNGLIDILSDRLTDRFADTLVHILCVFFPKLELFVFDFLYK